MDLEKIRHGSLLAAARMNFELPPTLPLLDPVLVMKAQREIEDRALTVAAVVAASYGFPKTSALTWLRSEGLDAKLSSEERLFLTGAGADADLFKPQVETLFAFAWALGMVSAVDFDLPLPANLVSIYPDLKGLESSTRFRAAARLRTMEELAAACDLAYCLHWAVNEAYATRSRLSGKVPAHVIVERHRAFEWMLSGDAWDEVALDT